MFQFFIIIIFWYIFKFKRLEWNEKRSRMENVHGVYTQCPDFGNTTGIEWLDPSVHGPGAYFVTLVNSLCNKFGYIRGKTLRAAPYDFRYDPGML